MPSQDEFDRFQMEQARHMTPEQRQALTRIMDELKQRAPEFLPGELNALQLIDTLAQEYGYGNLIAFLKHQWGKSLMRNNAALDWEAIKDITNVSPDPEDYNRIG